MPREACSSHTAAVDSTSQWFFQSCKIIVLNRCVVFLSNEATKSKMFILPFLTLCFFRTHKHTLPNNLNSLFHAYATDMTEMTNSQHKTIFLMSVKALITDWKTAPAPFLLFPLTPSIHPLTSLWCPYLLYPPVCFFFYKSTLPQHFIISMPCIHIIRHLSHDLVIWPLPLVQLFLCVSIAAPIFLTPSVHCCCLS